MPVIAENDTITARDEMGQMSAIDGLLYAACFGTSMIMLDEGTYSVRFNDEGTGAELVVTPSASSGYSLLGILNKRLFCSTDTLHIGRLMLNTTYHVYAEYTESLDTNPAFIRVSFYDEAQDRSMFMMPLCVVTTTPGSPSVDLDVDKPNASQVLAHAGQGNDSNPHGSTISQAVVNVTGSLGIRGGAANGAVYTSYTTQSGEYEMALPSGQSPVFIEAYPESASAGQIAWRISSGKAYLSNSGSAGIAVSLRIETEPSP